MALSKTTEAYIGFLKISDKAYAEKVRYYEDTFRLLITLPEEEKLELQVAYLNALFELGAYKKFLSKVDLVIPHLFDAAPEISDDKIALKMLLFRKASSLYNLRQDDASKMLCEQIIRMYPDQPEHKLLLRKLHRRAYNLKTRNLQALSIGLYLISGICIAIYLFIIGPFYLEYEAIGEKIWQGLFVLATVSLLSTELYIYLKVNNAVTKALNNSI